tara:strand:+ start:238 stop:558 length:321 start_codon:yes stop_codon:yes gene_type:complete
MIKILVIIAVLVGIAAAVYYFGFYKQGKINDRDGDFIPDEIEDSVEEVKRRAKNVKKELKDVKNAAKNLVSQSKDVIDAVKGKKRKGRKPKVNMPKPTNMGMPKKK